MFDHNTKITITKTKVKVDNKIDGQQAPLSFEEMAQFLITAMLNSMKQVVAATPKENKDAVRKNLYDGVNQAVSNMLDIFWPAQAGIKGNLSPDDIVMLADRLVAQTMGDLAESDPEEYKRRVEEASYVIQQERSRIKRNLKKDNSPVQ